VSDRQSRPRRRGLGHRVLPVVLGVVMACASNSGAESTTTAVDEPSTPTSTTVAVTSTTIAENTTTVLIDPVAVVGESLAASSFNYRFTSVVLIGEETLTTIAGIVDENSVAAVIGTGSTEVSYIRTSDGEWVTEADGAWVELEGEPPVTPPLAALVDAADLVLESGDGTRGVFTGVLGRAAGPARGIPFSLTVEDGVVTEIRYQVDTGGERALVITTFSDIGVAGTVNPPEGV